MISVPGIVITRSVRGRLSGLRWPDPRWSRRLVSLLTPELGRIPSSYDTTRPGSRAAGQANSGVSIVIHHPFIVDARRFADQLGS